MKALSIIALIVSFFGVVFSIGVMDVRDVCQGDLVTNRTALGFGFLLLICTLFMLAYSIVGTVIAFKKVTKSE